MAKRQTVTIDVDLGGMRGQMRSHFAALLGAYEDLAQANARLVAACRSALARLDALEGETEGEPRA